MLEDSITRKIQILPVIRPQLIQIRLSEDYSPMGKKQQNFEWPPVLNFENHIVGVLCDS